MRLGILGKPVLAGTEGMKNQANKKSVMIINSLALIVGAMVVGVGSYFYQLTGSLLILIPVLIETCSFLSVIFLNGYKKYVEANLVMLVVHCIFAVYWSIVLDAAISTELLSAFLFLIIFHLSGTFIVYQEKKIVVVCMALVVILSIAVQFNRSYHFITPLAISPAIQSTMRGTTSAAFFVLIALIMATYLNKIQVLLLSERQLKEVSERKSAFLRETFHELRTPLNAIFGNAQFLQQRKNSYSQHEKQEIENLYAASYITRNIVNNVLDMSRIDSGKFYVLIKEPVNLKECITLCVAMNSYLAASRGIAININYCNQLPIAINSDKLLLTKIFNNVLSNAVKFAPDNSTVLFSCFADQQLIVFEIQNEGAIEPEVSDKIFDAFVTTRSQLSEGTGLGLAITKHLVELFDGKIMLVPNNEDLTIVRFNIPLEIATDAVSVSHAFEYRKNCFFGATAVVIEDDLPSSTLLRKVLVEMGIQPIICSDANESITLIKEHRPTVVISDLNMPGMSGKELLTQINISKELKGIPVLIVSGDAFSTVKDELLEAGAAAFITKPVHFKELYQELSKQLPLRYAAV
ncbi:response regulator [Chitinophaga silvatica]|uniref:histidine kinase n=1 Tax=Chitinophaga silvatica TaxID=2282649 RepID=A0A3E1YAH5_9BACT|nr:hybrid sensor histidine kinase/response regulator [Chitinophaga silvatica]RFS22685.1 response regulator [Chitinophaga silvatica]